MWKGRDESINHIWMCEDARELIKDKWIKEVDKNGEKEKRGRTKLETTKATAGGIGTCTI